jgi:hypothetical protein
MSQTRTKKASELERGDTLCIGEGVAASVESILFTLIANGHRVVRLAGIEYAVMVPVNAEVTILIDRQPHVTDHG